MNLNLFGRTLAANRTKLLAVLAGLVAWGFFMPVIYATFGADLRRLLDSGVFPFPEELTQFGGGDVTTLTGSIALGFIHPITLVLVGVFAVGFSVTAVAGERQRGTLEVILSRPLSRRRLYVTVLLATGVFLGLAVGAVIAGSLISTFLWQLTEELRFENLPALWLNGTLLYLAIASVGLAASVSFDRLTPPLGITLAITLVSYFLQVLGSLWPDAEPLQPYSLFHYLKPKEVLENGLQPFDLALLGVVALAGVVYALVVFPRRDIAAPS